SSQKLHAHDPTRRIMLEVFLEKKKTIGFPNPLCLLDVRARFVVRRELLDPCAAAALLGLEQRRPSPVLLLIQPRAKRIEIVEHDRSRRPKAKPTNHRRLCSLRQLERECTMTVEDHASGSFERLEQRKRKRDCARIASNVCTWARLIEH